MSRERRAVWIVLLALATTVSVWIAVAADRPIVDESFDGVPPSPPAPTPPRRAGAVLDPAPDDLVRLWDEQRSCTDVALARVDGDGGLAFAATHNAVRVADQRLAEVWTHDAMTLARARFAAGCRTLRADLQSADTLRAWQDVARDALARVLRLDLATWPDLPSQVRELDRSTIDGIERVELDYLVEPGLRSTATLLVPAHRAGPSAAVLFIHGHGEGGRRSPLGDPPYDDDIHHAGALRLAEAGYVVLVPDVRSFGEHGSRETHRHYAEWLSFQGLVAYGVFTADMIRALDLLEARPEVDPERIGVAGLSMGGQLAAYVAALDPRPRAAVVQGYLGYQSLSLSRVRADPCQYIPMLNQLMDIPDIALIAAPTPTLWVAGEHDVVYPADEARRAWAEIERGYAVLGATDAAVVWYHDGGHEWVHEPALSFFDQHLRPQP